MNWTVPTIAGIQRTTAIVLATAALLLLCFFSLASAIGCVLGGVIAIVNLYFLAFIGRLMLAVGRLQGGATGFGVIAAPLKMFLLVGVVYLIIASGRIDVAGLMLGFLTQLLAIFIETWRVSTRGMLMHPEDSTFGAG